MKLDGLIAVPLEEMIYEPDANNHVPNLTTRSRMRRYEKRNDRLPARH